MKKTTDVIIGIDPGIKTGWAIIDRSRDVIAAGTYENRDDGKFYSGFIAEIAVALPRNSDVVFAAIEGQFCGPNPRQALRLARRAGVLEAAVYALGCQHEVWFPSPSEWRSILDIETRDRKKAKKQAVDTALSLGWETYSSDEADAICIALAASLSRPPWRM